MIRKMTKKDLETVSNLYLDANPFAKIEDIYNWTKKWYEEYPDFSLIYESNNEIIWAISAIIENNIPVINDIFTKTSDRNKWIWTILMQELLLILDNTDYEKINLWVHRKNSPAIKFYYKFWFRLKQCIITQGISWVPDWEDVILLEKIR